ncbi:MAG: hypothetical protein C0497_15570, partial [Gemmatimonas sp.]|nr:hypothetical protein [Gemmatimonas sp.]
WATWWAIFSTTITRWNGALFLLYYVAYTAYLVLVSAGHDELSGFSMVMTYFALQSRAAR